jgi:DNA/RNA endonuclease YhcR with UshA esterase domain
MRCFAVLAALAFIPVLLAENPQGLGKKVIGPAEAAKMAKEAQVTVEMMIKAVGISKEKEHWWLNSETDWKDAKNFSVFIPKSVVEALKKTGVTDPDKQYKGRTVQVTGYLSVHKTTPEITLHEADQIKIIKK